MSERGGDTLSMDAIMGMARGFMTSRVLLTAVELDLFTRLGGERRSAAELAVAIGTDTRALAHLLDVLAGLGFLEKGQGGYVNAPISREILTRDAPESILAGLEHTAHIWHRWDTLTEVVHTGKPVEFDEINDRGEEWIESFLGAMAVYSRARAPQVAQAIGLTGVRRLLDVGGGPGVYSIAFAEAQPGLTAVVFDLPNAVHIAERNIAAAGLQERITTCAGDMRSDELGEGFDLLFVSAIVHMLSYEENRELLHKCARALDPGGRVVIQDHIMGEDRTRPVPGALFAINMLVGTEGGSTYTESEMRAWLEDAGFVGIQRIDLPGPNGLMVGTKG